MVLQAAERGPDSVGGSGPTSTDISEKARKTAKIRKFDVNRVKFT